MATGAKEEEIILLKADIEANNQDLANARADGNEALILACINHLVELRKDLRKLTTPQGKYKIPLNSLLLMPCEQAGCESGRARKNQNQAVIYVSRCRRIFILSVFYLISTFFSICIILEIKFD